MAVTTGHGECYNPTEAGSKDDDTAVTTTTQLVYCSTDRGVLHTSALPAFWMRPGELHQDPTESCSAAINTARVSQYRMNKTVSVSPWGIEYNATVEVPEDLPWLLCWMRFFVVPLI